MSAHCSICGTLIFDEDFQCYGEEVGGEWTCDVCLLQKQEAIGRVVLLMGVIQTIIDDVCDSTDLEGWAGLRLSRQLRRIYTGGGQFKKDITFLEGITDAE